jgi:hypothetical protein
LKPSARRRFVSVANGVETADMLASTEDLPTDAQRIG